jgi:hypothetical protein
MTLSTDPRPTTDHRKRDVLLTVAVLCAALPTLCGLVLFALVRETRSETLAGSGLWVIGCGAVLSIVGTACLAARARHQRGPGRTSEGRGAASLIAIWLVANYPLAAFLTYRSIILLSAVVIHVENESGASLEFFRLEGAGFFYEAAPLMPGERVDLELHPTRDGAILFSGRFLESAIAGGGHSGGRPVLEGTAVGYVTPGMGLETTLRITPTGEIVILDD